MQPGEGSFKSFTSLGIGVGALSASAVAVATKYYYIGNINNFNMKLFEETTINASISGGEILVGAGNVNFIVNKKHPGEYLIGIGIGIGVGVGIPVSGQITWQKTHIYW